MQHKLTALVVFAFFTIPSVANATFIEGNREDSSSTYWTESFGNFTYFSGGLLGGGGTNQMSARYDAATQVLQLTSNYLPGFYGPRQAVGNVVFSLTANVSNTGVFGGGSYSMMVGSAGVNGLSLSSGTQLLSGSVVDFDSARVEIPGGSPGCSPFRTVCYHSASNGWTPALVSVDYAAPELLLSAHYLTVIPYLFGPRDFEIPWSRSANGLGFQGWTLFASNQIPVPEPAALWLLCIGLVGVGYMQRRKID